MSSSFATRYLATEVCVIPNFKFLSSSFLPTISLSLLSYLFLRWADGRRYKGRVVEMQNCESLSRGSLRKREIDIEREIEKVELIKHRRERKETNKNIRWIRERVELIKHRS
uniref:Transmembrane protein n=1 Tax=Cacopsylla melanoneura TaxID=428564 RepID=A0A8D9E893_9HEMI